MLGRLAQLTKDSNVPVLVQLKGDEPGFPCRFERRGAGQRSIHPLESLDELHQARKFEVERKRRSKSARANDEEGYEPGTIGVALDFAELESGGGGVGAESDIHCLMCMAI